MHMFGRLMIMLHISVWLPSTPKIQPNPTFNPVHKVLVSTPLSTPALIKGFLVATQPDEAMERATDVFQQPPWASVVLGNPVFRCFWTHFGPMVGPVRAHNGQREGTRHAISWRNRSQRAQNIRNLPLSQSQRVHDHRRAIVSTILR